VTHFRNVVFDETLPVLHAQPMSSHELFDPSQFSRADPQPPQLFDPVTSSNDRGESRMVSLDDMPAPETMPAPVHKPTPTIPAYTSMSSPISSSTHAPTSPLSSATAPAVQAPPSITREQKRLEITTPRLLNSRGATTKVPTAKTSSGHTVYANTRYSQPDKKSPSSHASTCWVLKIKHDGSYKARWVARGFSQHEGIDYLDTYTPVLRLENLRFLLAYAILMGYEIHSMDVDLQALLDEDIYVSQAEGFESKEHPDYVCCLIRALYGLKEAPLAWNCTLNQYLLDLGFESAPADPCVYPYHGVKQAQ